MGQYLELADKALAAIKTAPDRPVLPNDINDINDKRIDGITVSKSTDPSQATEPFNQEAMAAIQCGQAVPVWSDLLSEWLYWVRGEPERQALRAQGCQMPIYTLGELAVVVQHDPEDIKKLHAAKRTFSGVIGPARSER